MVKDLKRQLSRLENYLYDSIYCNFSQLPEYLEKPLLKYLPAISIILGLLCLLSCYDLWHTAHSVNALISYANANAGFYGVPRMSVDHHMGFGFYLAVVILLFEAYLFFKASQRVNRRTKAGWDLLFYGFVVNVVYGIVMLFNFYGGFGTFFERLLFSLVSFYFLFEIRDSFSLHHPHKKKS